MESADRPRTLSMVLAGGEGSRLHPLTVHRAKPAVPFGGQYRLIDFALSNLVNGGYRKIVVLTQYKSHSLDVHISRTWRLSTMLGSYVTTVPAQMRRGPHWFAGSADALFQNMNLIDDEDPEYIFVFGADHIYRIDPRQFLDQHIASGAGVSVAGIRIPIDDANQFGVIERGDDSKITTFREKPSDAVGLNDDPTKVLASMGNYIFSRDTFIDILRSDAGDEDSKHDIGGDLIPALVAAGEAHVYDYTTNVIPGEDPTQHYWRDVGTLDSYYEATMDLVAPEPKFNLYNQQWPIHTLGRHLPPAKFVLDGAQECELANAMVSRGVIVSGGTVRNSVLSPGVRVDAGAVVEDSILMDDVHIGAGAVVKKTVIDKHVDVPAGVHIGEDREADASQFTVSNNGVVAIAKGTVI
ncbi:MAG: glucose-1-phosphate adenylyltransferase [Acidimicrobiales bacterium]